jgi:hypothetical protein
MAGSKSIYLEAAILDFVLGGVAYVPPGTVYIALSTAAFTVTATGAAMDEVAGGAYARQAMPNDLTNWPAASVASPAVKLSGTDIVFPTATADWGTVLSGYIVDAAVDGNVLYGADLAAPTTVNIGSGFGVPTGQFALSET